MGYLSKGRLRAYLDGELDATEHEAVEREISRGAPAARAARLGATAETVRSRLEVVAPQTEPDLEPAIARARASRRQGAQAASGERSPSMGSRIIRKPALAGGLVLLLLVGLLSFGQGRAFARQLLSVFRVRRFAVVQMRLDPDRFEEVVSHLEETLFVTGDPVMIQEPTRTTVDTIEEASTAAGFDVRMPAYWPDGGTPRITVEGPSEQALRFRGDGLRLLLELAEMDPAAIPAELLEDEVRVASGGAVYLKGSNTSITQVSNITATYPDGIDAAVIVEAALRVLGVDPDEAHRLSQQHDWSCTALIPVLSDAIEVRETEIAGADALLVRAESQGPHANRATLLMERDGILYIVAGSASFERLAQVAQSMF
jgi:hypothetical protein